MLIGFRVLDLSHNNELVGFVDQASSRAAPTNLCRCVGAHSCEAALVGHQVFQAVSVFVCHMTPPTLPP